MVLKIIYLGFESNLWTETRKCIGATEFSYTFFRSNKVRVNDFGKFHLTDKCMIALLNKGHLISQ